jgi:hypothetical protein
VWYDVRMTKAELIEIAQMRFRAYVKKVYGDKTEPSEEAINALTKFLDRPRIYEKLFKVFLAECDACEMYALRRDEQATAIKENPFEELQYLFQNCKKHLIHALL